MLAKQETSYPPWEHHDFHDHVLKPLRALFPEIRFSLLYINSGQPCHADPSRTDQPDLADWTDHDWEKALPEEGTLSFSGWSFYPFGIPACGAIAIDAKRAMLQPHQDRAIQAQASLLGTLVSRRHHAPSDTPQKTNPVSGNAQDHPPLIQLGFFLWSSKRNRLTGDPRMAALCGLDAERLRHGITWAEFCACIHEHDRPAPHEQPVRWMIDSTREGIRLFTARERLSRVHISAQRHGEECTGTAIDITHEDRLALRTSQSFINSILVSANDCIKILDLDGVITFVNHGAVRVLNLCAPSDMIGLYWPDVWQERGRYLTLEAIDAARRGETSHFQEYVETSDGRTRLWDVVVAPILGADGRTERILGVSRDMTVANQEHERLELALEAGTIIGMWLWNARYQLVTGDTRMAETLDLPPEQLATGLSLVRLMKEILSEDRPAVRAALEMALHEKTRFRCEFRLRDKGLRTSRWVEANGAPRYDQHGELCHFPGILLDIDTPKRQTLKRDALVLFGDELRTLSTADDILELTARTIGITIEADRSGFADVDHERELAQVTDSWRRNSSVPDASGLYAFRAFGTYIDLLKRGEVVAIDDVRTSPLTTDQADSFMPLQIRALLNVPIMEKGILQAVAIVHFAHPHCWDEITLAFVRTIADRSWAAIRQVRAQEALRRLNETLEEQVLRRTRERDRLWAISTDLLALMDRDGRLRYLNPSWQNCFGDKARDWLGSKLEQLVHPDDILRATEVVALLSEGQLDHGVDLRFLCHDGAWHTFNWSGSIESDDIYLTGRDVTDRIALEDQLRQSQKMELSDS